MLGISRSHEVKERVNGREPDITRGDPVFSALLQIGQKRQNSGGIQINQVEHRNGLLSLLRNKAEQQNADHEVAKLTDFTDDPAAIGQSLATLEKFADTRPHGTADTLGAKAPRILRSVINLLGSTLPKGRPTPGVLTG